MGVSPSSLTVLPDRTALLSNKPQANIMDYKPMVNIMPFGLCKSLANPTVASATTARGVLTPMPCIPNTTTPWMPAKSNMMVKGQPALQDNCQLICGWAGTIKIITNGQ